MGKSYLVEGARLKCLCGSECSSLKVTDHGYYADGRKKANCKDCLPEVNMILSISLYTFSSRNL